MPLRRSSRHQTLPEREKSPETDVSIPVSVDTVVMVSLLGVEGGNLYRGVRYSLVTVDILL